MSFAYRTTKLGVDLITKMIKADVRVHNAEVIKDDMDIIFVANHFTRIETFLLPHALLKHTDGHDIQSLAASDLFVGKLGNFLKSLGTVSTRDPDRDKIIIRSLLAGESHWVIFPEGAMIKDKKLINEEGEFEIYHKGERRRPFTGAAALAIQTELYRQTIKCLRDFGKTDEFEKAKQRFEIDDCDVTLSRRTVIIPVNITYFPIRSQENFFLRTAQRLSEKISARAIEELAVEGSILSNDTDVDITLGEPINVLDMLRGPEFSEHMTCATVDLHQLEKNPDSHFNRTARELMHRYMAEIYARTTINYEHIFATLIRYQQTRRFTERSYRNRIFLASRAIIALNKYRLHGILERTYREIIYEDFNPKFQAFIDLCLKQGILRKEGRHYVKVIRSSHSTADFHSVRQDDITYVIANEIEPLSDVTDIIRSYAEKARPELSREVREFFLKEDREMFDADYLIHAREGGSKTRDVGEPFLLLPERIRAGIVMIHGYLAAPLEVRAMAEHFKEQGFAVYGVRLRGHGTSPEDLSETPWEEWYESVNRGYCIIKSLTDDIIMGGFSTGGGLALMAAGRKGNKIRGVFSINAPLHLRNYAVHMIPSVSFVGGLFARMRGKPHPWEYVQTRPENAHINYNRNPVSAVKQLSECIRSMEKSLKDIVVPTMLVQAFRDPIVDPVSAQLIFSQIGTPRKELLILDRDRHGIINGEGTADVFERVQIFLNWARRQSPVERQLAESETVESPEKPSRLDDPLEPIVGAT